MNSKSYNRPMTHQEYIRTKYLSQDDYETKEKKRKIKKSTGLLSAKEIRKELDELKRKNENFMKGLKEDQSGKNAKTIFRDRKTGKIRNVEKELEEKKKEVHEKEQKEAEKKATYDRWSKGLVQREAHLERLENDLHEMSKPLARYGNDSDLDKMLRDKERLDDPMLQEMRKKREEEEKEKNPNLKVFPKYKGPPPPPNRFNIQPGYRWDGVDRSTGYEAKIFARQSNAEASQEEAYRWSTQDM